jgi:hypothetical protein
MVEGASATDTIHQRILYLGLSNQCWKCRKFEHHARICNTNKIKPQEGPIHHNFPPSVNLGGLPNSHLPPQGATRESKLAPPQSSNWLSNHGERQSACGSKDSNGPPFRPHTIKWPDQKTHRKLNIRPWPMELDVRR